MLRSWIRVAGLALAAAVCTGGASRAMAITHTASLHPTPIDLYDLDHYRHYTWGIGWSVPENQYIAAARLFLDDIRNWDPNPNVLYTRLIDTNFVGLQVGTDNEGGGDSLAAYGVSLFEWHNLPMAAQDLTYHFTATDLNTLRDDAADGLFGVGFDPDCHFYNSGVWLQIDTQPRQDDAPPTPEPATAAMALLSGMGVLAATRRGRASRRA